MARLTVIGILGAMSAVIALVALADLRIFSASAGAGDKSPLIEGAVASCAACHGAKGEGRSAAATPRLAGLNAAYIEAQLRAFAEGARANPIMSPLAKTLDDEKRRDIATYYAGLPMPRPVIPRAVSSSASAGAVLAQRGDWSHGIPACRECHGPAGQGVGSAFPPLAGQPATYIAAELDAWKAGTRHDDPQDIMKAVATKLTPEQIASVAEYYADGPSGSAIADRQIPDDAFGKVIRRGEAIFNETPSYAGGFLGNKLTCANCHLDAGRLAFSAPMGAAYVKYPMFRKKEGKVLNFAERLQGCFRYSMNGKPPPLGGDELVALESYAFFLAKGEPVGAKVPGEGYPVLPKPSRTMDFQRGGAVFAAKCAICHGSDGNGQTVDGPAGAKQVVFPALWGPGSYNWGAGMGRIDKAAGFIKANMPLGLGNSLSDQEAWDVAFFVDGHERPQDPRFTGDLSATRLKFHDTPMSSYGSSVGGVLLGEHSPPAGPQPNAARQRWR